MRTAFATVLFVLASAQIFAEGRQNLSQLSAEALKNHPRIAAMQADREAARARRELSLAPYRPQLSLNGYAATGNGSMIFPSSVEPHNYSLLPSGATGVANGTVMWRLFTFGRDRAVAAAGASEVKASEAAIQAESLDVLFSLRTAFGDALYKQNVQTAHQAALASAREIERTTQARFEAGKVPEAFVLRAKADTARAERDVAMAHAEAVSAVARVWEAAGRSQSDGDELGEWDLKFVAPQDQKGAIVLAIERRPEIVALNQQINSVRSLQSATAKSKLPELSFMAMNDLMGIRGRRGENGFKAGLVLSFPLSDGGQRNAEANEQKAMVAHLKSEAKALRNRIASEVAQAWAEWSAVEPINAAAQAELTASEEAYRVALIRYQEGKSILAELTDSRSQLTHARLSVAEATAYSQQAWSKVTRSIGGE